MKVCVVGLGNVGMATASYLKIRDIETYGIDIDKSIVEKANKNGILSYEDFLHVPSCDVYIICVSTWDKLGNPNLTHIYNVSKNIYAHKIGSPLVSIESTIPPGTCDNLYKTIFMKEIKLIHVPHRWWTGDPVNYGVNQMRVIGGIDQDSINCGVHFYGEKLSIPLYQTKSIKEAELSKIVENAYRFVQIACAEEIKLICEDMNIDFEAVRSASNTKWNIEILEARNGIGGHCLPKDIALLSSLSKNALILKSSIKLDAEYKKKSKINLHNIGC